LGNVGAKKEKGMRGNIGWGVRGWWEEMRGKSAEKGAAQKQGRWEIYW